MPQHQTEPARITSLSQDADALLQQRSLLPVSEVAMMGGHRGPVQGSASSNRYHTRSPRRGVRQPVKSFTVVRAAPEAAQRTREPLFFLSTVRVRLAPDQRRPQVVMLYLKALDHWTSSGPTSPAAASSARAR